MSKQILLNGWFYSFAIGWILFLLLIDWRLLKKNIWAGIACSVTEVWQDGIFVHEGAYLIQNPGINLFGTSAFFTFGLAFTMGILFMQYLPKNKILQIMHIIIFTVGFLIFELILVKSGLFAHLRYSYSLSFFLNILIMAGLAWFKELIYSQA